MAITWILLIIAIIIPICAHLMLKSTFSKYLRVDSAKGINGAMVAQRMLASNGIHDVRVEITPEKLSDHYDPKAKAVRLSPDVYSGTSLASLGVAAHEVGHAIQHNHGYFPLELRSNLVPVANIGSMAAFPVIIAGFIFGSSAFINIGIYLIAAVLVFQIVTLPVEFNASNRAIGQLKDQGFIGPQEVSGVKKVLTAAALTYVAAVIVTVLELVRLLIISKLMND